MLEAKICGITNIEDLSLCVKNHVPVLGFVVEYPAPVPWNLTAEQAQTLISKLPLQVKSCMVTSGAPEQVVRLARQLRPDRIQLHGRESPSEVQTIAADLAPLGIQIIKAVHASPSAMWLKHAAAFARSGADALLLDPRTPDDPASSGQIDLEQYRMLHRTVAVPVILAGGITPDNLQWVVSRANPDAIDLLSGVESSPGKKDPYKVAALIEQLAQIDMKTRRKI